MSDQPGRAVPATRLWVAAICLAAATGARGVDITGAVSAGAIYSDNINLAPDGQEDGDLVYRVDPSIAVSSIGTRYTFNLDYTLEALFYQDQADSEEIYHQGTATLDLALIEETLFLNTLAAISQVVVDPEQPFSQSNITQISNRADATRYQVGPQWKQDIYGTALDVRYDVGHVDYDDDLLQDGDYTKFRTDWTGPEKERGLTWDLHHEYVEYDYEISPEAVRQLAEARLVYELGSGWAPFVSAGLESDVKDRTDASLEDGIWRAGVRRQTARTNFEAFVGDRSFGSTWGARLERQYGADTGDIFRIAYRETPRTSEELDATLEKPVTAPGTPPPPVPPLPGVPPDPVAPGTGQFYLSKRGDLLLARTFGRSAASVNVFYEDTENLEDATPEDSDDTRQTGVALLWTYDIGPRTEAGLDGYFVARDFSRVAGEDDGDNLLAIRARLTYALGARTALVGYVGREERSGSEEPASNYTENQVGISVSRTF